MTDWQPKPGDTVMVVNPKGYGVIESAKHVVGSNAIFNCVVNSVKKSAPVGIVEDAGGGFHCFRMDMIAQPVDPRRAVLERVFEMGADMGSSEHELGLTPEQIFKNSVIRDALQKLDNLPPF